MINNLNFNFNSTPISKIPPANSRIQEINDTINKLDGKTSTEVKSFSELLPNTQPNEPVKLLSPQLMVNLIKENSRKYGVIPN